MVTTERYGSGRYGSGGECEVVIHFPDGEDRTLPEEGLDAIYSHRRSIIEAQHIMGGYVL